MFYKVIEEFKNIIKSYEIKDCKKFGKAKALVAKIELIDHSILYVRELC